MGSDASLRSQRYRKLVELLHRARNDARLTQAEVAARMQRPQQWVSQCERGRRRIDFVELEDFARIYAKPVHWFLTTASAADLRPEGAPPGV